jgi:FkbM family methyltransferase
VSKARRLTADWKSFARLATDFALYRLMRFVRLPGSDGLRSVRLREGVELYYRLNRGDIWAIYEVWMESNYDLPFEVRRRVLVDLGANIGLTSLWYAKRMGFEKVLAVEPSAGNAAVARKNLRENKVHSTLTEAAIGAVEGEAMFFEYNWSTHNALVFEPTEQPRSGGGLKLLCKYHVPILSMRQLLENLATGTRVDLLKLDIEGGEQELFASDISWLDSVDAITAEFHLPHANVPWIIAILQKAGFEYHPPSNGFETHNFVRRSAT